MFLDGIMLIYRVIANIETEFTDSYKEQACSSSSTESLFYETMPFITIAVLQLSKYQ